jgi:hypothetical protein
MVGLTPTTAFLDFLRVSPMGCGAVLAVTIKKETNSCRYAIFCCFGEQMASARGSRYISPGEDLTSRVTSSSTSIDDNDWVIDMDATDCSVTDIHRLTRYCLEHWFKLNKKTKHLLLVSVN